MPKRKICVVTGSRSEYGLLRWLMQEIKDDPALQLQLLVTGMHLAPEFGMTVNEITADGFVINEIVESQLASDTHVGMAKSLGLGIIGCSDAFRRLQPDIVVLLGDRYEILAAAQAASLMGIPIGHLYGGEITEGAVDDWMRHAITKASWWHFVAAEPYRQRVVQLGEAPDRVHNVGAPGLDAIYRIPLLDRDALEAELGMPLSPPLFVVTYHSVTLGQFPPEQAFGELLHALGNFPEATVVLTKPNADAGGRQIAEMAETWAENHRSHTRFVVSLGQLRYLSLVQLADAVIGNSSSGIIEAPALQVPTVNIGQRQDGRLKADSIVDCGEDRKAISAAIHQVLSDEFKASLLGAVSLYGDCNASREIKKILTAAELPDRLVKRFHNL